MAHHQNRQLGRPIVRALVMQRLAADGAAFAHLEIVAQHGSRSAAGAAAPPATQQRGFQRSVIKVGLFVHLGLLSGRGTIGPVLAVGKGGAAGVRQKDADEICRFHACVRGAAARRKPVAAAFVLSKGADGCRP